MQRLDAMLSNYKPHSEWSEMNRGASYGPFRVSDELFRLIEQCLRYSEETEGTFDISVGPLMKVWGFYKGSGHLADRTSVENALKDVGYRYIVLDRQSMTVRFNRPGLELDPGGIGKGYAVDRVVQVLKHQGIESALVSAGGSSIYALGSPPGKSGWKVHLADPKQPSHAIETVFLRDESLSTSGSYERFFCADGRMWSHIMDPRTGYPSEGMLSASVIAPQTIDSEVWAKPFFILGRRWTAEHKPQDLKVFLCEDKPANSCTWVF
jgi:thiamine biosynthesis lipoprotein